MAQGQAVEQGLGSYSVRWVPFTEVGVIHGGQCHGPMSIQGIVALSTSFCFPGGVNGKDWTTVFSREVSLKPLLMSSVYRSLPASVLHPCGTRRECALGA